MVSPNSNKGKLTNDKIKMQPRTSEASTMRQLTNLTCSLPVSVATQNHAFKPYMPLSYTGLRNRPYPTLSPYAPHQPQPHPPPTNNDRGKSTMIVEDDSDKVKGIELTARQLDIRKHLADEKDCFKVEAIRRKRISKEGKPQYLIKWRDFGEHANNWEYAENLNEPSRDLIAAYERSLLSAKGKQKLTLQEDEIRYVCGESTSNISPAIRSLSNERQVVEPVVTSNRTQSTERQTVQALEAYDPSNPKHRRAYSKRPVSNGRVNAAESSKKVNSKRISNERQVAASVANTQLWNPEPRRANIAANQNEAFKIATAARSVDRDGYQTVSPAVASLNRNYANQSEAFKIATAARSVDRSGSQTVSPAVASLNCNYANQSEAFKIATAAKSVDRSGSQTVSPAVASLNRNYASLQLPGPNAYGNSLFFREKMPVSRENATIIKINKAISHFFIPGDSNKPSVIFKATCSDGTVITVENKYLRPNYPQLLLDFYEIRYAIARCP